MHDSPGRWTFGSSRVTLGIRETLDFVGLAEKLAPRRHTHRDVRVRVFFVESGSVKVRVGAQGGGRTESTCIMGVRDLGDRETRDRVRALGHISEQPTWKWRPYLFRE